jgi:uncharacterized protein YndB with AHSA1/START domain
MDLPYPARTGSMETGMTQQIGSMTAAERDPAAAGSEGALVITRVLDAPRDLVWRAWTEPERVKCWWGPKDFSAPVAKVDLRPGGRYLYAMRSPEGRDFWSTGTYREVVEPERIVATDSFSDAEGNVVPASQYGMAGDWPLELVTTFTFEEVGGRTRLTIRHEGLPAGEQREMAGYGWNESLDKLEACLKGARPS